MEQTTNNTSLSKNDKEIVFLIKYFAKRKFTYLSIVALSGILSFYLLKFHFLEYKSTASFYVNTNNVFSINSGIVDGNGNGNPAIDNVNRIFEMINSVSTHQYLIKKFNLMKHYGIDSTNEFSSQQALAIIRNNIIVKKSPLNTISITVSDRYRYLAADIANEVVRYTEQQNQEFFLNNFRKKAEISNAFLNLLETENQKKYAAISELIKNLNVIILSDRDSKNSERLFGQQQQLSQLIGEFKSSTHDIVNSQKLYAIALQALNYKNFPTINLHQFAMPAFRSLVYTAAFFSILIMIIVSSILILQVYFYNHYREYFKKIFAADE